jgi:hypothetical protein
VQGGASSTSSFTTAYLAGAAVAAVGVIGAVFIRSAERTDPRVGVEARTSPSASPRA